MFVTSGGAGGAAAGSVSPLLTVSIPVDANEFGHGLQVGEWLQARLGGELVERHLGTIIQKDVAADDVLQAPG